MWNIETWKDNRAAAIRRTIFGSVSYRRQFDQTDNPSQLCPSFYRQTTSRITKRTNVRPLKFFVPQQTNYVFKLTAWGENWYCWWTTQQSRIYLRPPEGIRIPAWPTWRADQFIEFNNSWKEWNRMTCELRKYKWRCDHRRCNRN